MEGLSNTKCVAVEIKSEENYSDIPLQKLKDEPFDCTNTSLLTDCLDVKEEIKDICDDTAVEHCSDIKFEYVESESQEDYSDSPLQSLKEEPVASTNECQSEYVKTTNNFTVKRKGKRYGYDSKNFCDYETDRKKYLTHHEHRRVPEEQMFKCDSCNYKTVHKSQFTQHQRIHRGVLEKKVLKCNACDYKTIHRTSITRHQLKHKDVPEEQMFKCDSCDYKTIYKPYFTQHQLRHKDIPEKQKFKCVPCGYETIYKRYFAQHQLRHKNTPQDHMYKCNLCDYKTVSARCLDCHLITH